MGVAFQMIEFALGVLGMASVLALPLRSVFLLRRHARHWRETLPWKTALLAVALAATVVVIFEAQQITHLHACLTGEHCGPRRNEGWLVLAGMGIWYLLFEAFANAALILADKHSARQPIA